MTDYITFMAEFHADLSVNTVFKTRAYLGIWDLRPRGRIVERHHVKTILDKLRSYQVTIHQNIVTCGQNSKAAAFVSSLFVDQHGTDMTRKDQDRDENMWIFIFINIQT